RLPRAARPQGRLPGRTGGVPLRDRARLLLLADRDQIPGGTVPTMSAHDVHYAHQQHYYDEACDPEFEICRPHGCGRVYEYLIGHKFETGIPLLALDVAARPVLHTSSWSRL